MMRMCTIKCKVKIISDLHVGEERDVFFLIGIFPNGEEARILRPIC